MPKKSSISVLEESGKFLDMFRDVSSILDIGTIQSYGTDRLFEIDGTLDNLLKSDDIFIKIVVSLHMNTKDPGFHNIRRLSEVYSKKKSMEESFTGLGSVQIKSMIGLLEQVLKGIKYTTRKNDSRVNKKPIKITESFLLYLKNKL